MKFTLLTNVLERCAIGMYVPVVCSNKAMSSAFDRVPFVGGGGNQQAKNGSLECFLNRMDNHLAKPHIGLPPDR